MKKIFIAFLFSSIAFISCTKDEATDPAPTNTTPSYNFIDQPLQGKIEGANWEFASGIAYYDNFQELFWLDFYNEVDTNQCDFDKPQTDKIFFAFSNLTPGLTELGIFTQSVTFYDNDSALNVIGFDGAIEILTVDTLNTMTITGRMDVRESGTNYANGNFSITYCK